MKTPAAKAGAVCIAVRPTHDLDISARVLARPSDGEAWQIAKAIRPRLTEYVAQYDTKKYWPDVYQRVRREFRQPERVSTRTLREALRWKYGHLGKPSIPTAHELLISQLQRGWSAAVAALPSAPENAITAIDRYFGGKTRFITVAFLLHLLHPRKVPIIDQHNFRAVNALLGGVRPAWKNKKKPAQYADILLVAEFMEAVLAAWRRRAPKSVPSDRALDKFLMMYGKAIKQRSNRLTRRRLSV